MTSYHTVLRRGRMQPFTITQHLCCPRGEYTLCGLQLEHEATCDVVNVQQCTWPDLKNHTGICRFCLGHAQRFH